jgi:aerobic C4-dicarboxylate transport protein
MFVCGSESIAMLLQTRIAGLLTVAQWARRDLKDMIQTPPRIFRTLYFRVIVGIVAGILVGVFYPHVGEQLKPLSDVFLKLIRMMIAPIIFFSVVAGIATIGNTRKLGRVGLKAMIYFEGVTTFALLLGLAVAKIVQPGRGMNVDPATLDARSVAQYTTEAKHLGVVEFIQNTVPDNFASAFTKGEILQVLLLAILCGLALVALDREKQLVKLCESLTQLFFKIITFIMEAAPIGAFGAMAFTIGRYGPGSLVSLGRLLLCVYLTSFAFIFFGLGLICHLHGVSLWKFLKYIREEIFIALGTSSSESVLPRLIIKMERLGCSRSVVGLVVPTGYSFNLDGTSIYLSIGALFIAQATNTHLSFREEALLLAFLMLNSKGAAAVTGGGFITLAATLAALGSIPIAGITLLLGVDRFMSEMRTITNLIGNGVATIVIARWENEFNARRAQRILDGEDEIEEERLAAEDVVASV